MSWLSVGVGLAKSILGNRSRRKEVAAQNQLEMQKYTRLRSAAEAGGFHPLEVLRAGGEVNATAAPRLMSTLAASNAFDTLAEEVSGEGAAKRKRQEVEDEIRERELEILRQQAAGGVINQSTINTNRPPKLPTPAVGMDKAKPQQRPGYWTGESIPVVMPTGDTINMPKRLAERLGVKQWDPIIADDLEAIAGDEISQVIFGDWLASNGLILRNGNIEKKDVYTTGDLVDDVSDTFRRRPVIGPATRRDKNPKPGWMDEMFGKGHN